MATRPRIPYYAPAELLPAPLPTVAQILASKQRLSHKSSPTQVVRIGEHYVVKYLGGTTVQEGENMLFVQQSTSLPVPKVYAIFEESLEAFDGVKAAFIVMEYIAGKTLEMVWDELGEPKKRDIVLQLRRHLDELHSIPSPGYYGGIWGQPILDQCFENKVNGMAYREPEIAGPHETEEQFVEAMLRCLDKAVRLHEFGPEARARWLAFRRCIYHAVFRGHKSVFTHADLKPVNVILREDGSLVIIDWERAGWYPSFWEFCTAMMGMDFQNDWAQWALETHGDGHVTAFTTFAIFYESIVLYN